MDHKIEITGQADPGVLYDIGTVNLALDFNYWNSSIFIR